MSTYSGYLHFSNLPHPITAYIFPDSVLHTSLLSVSELCNVGCLATFTDTHFHVTYNDLIVIKGTKAPTDTLWTVQLPTRGDAMPSSNISSNSARLTDDAQFVLFAHASLGSPVYSTFIHAIRAGYLSSWPRLTTALALAHPPHTIATAKGHLNQKRQGVDSTKSILLPLPDEELETATPQLPLSAESANHVYVKVVRLPHTVSSDLTGKFPVQADSGAQYVLISEMDGYIHADPLSSRHHTSYISSFTRTIAFFTALGRIPFFLRLDNETSTPLDAFMKRQGIKIQYCPPGMHRANRAERSIQTFKNQAIATLCTTSKDFPLTLWDRLLPQIELCLNHLHPYKPNPTISAYAGLHGGAHDFRANPIGPAGSKILIHDKPGSRGSWAPHGVPGFYLGPALKHYRCYTVWSTSTNAVRITDTLAWFLDNLQLPSPSIHDLLLAAIHDLTTALNTVTRAHPTSIHQRQLSETPSITQQLLDIAALYTPSASEIPTQTTLTDTTAGTEQRVTSPVPLASTDTLSPGAIPPPPEQRVPKPSQQDVLKPQKQALVPPPEHPPPEQSGSPLPGQREPLPIIYPTTVPIHRPANIDALPNVHFLPTGQPPTVPTPPTPPVTRQHTARQRALAYAALNLAADGSPLTYSKAKAGPDAARWLQAESEEFDRLFKSQTMKPIHQHQQPPDRRRDTTYFNPQTKQKIDSAGDTTYRIRGTAGGDRINYTGPTSAQTAAMPVVKLLLHSVVSEHKSWMTIDIKDYYLNTPLLRPEFIRIPLRMIPTVTMDNHSLHSYVQQDAILFEVNKGMYGLPQAGLLAQQRLMAHLTIHGYHETSTPCLFRHASNGTDFTLVVDDFGIKYSSRAGADHLIRTLQLLYVITIDWTGSTYIGFTIDFDNKTRQVSLSMPGYISKVLQRFAPNLSIGAASPAIYTPPSYGAATQTASSDNSPALSPAAIKTLQEQVGCLLYYARGVDATILPAVNHIASLQSLPTTKVAAAMERLLQYCARFPNNTLVFTACDMRLFIQSDASYLSRPKSRSVAGGVFYLGNNNQPTTINGPCLALSTIIPVVVSSVAEAEYAAVFMNAKEGASLRAILDSIGYPQPTTDILCDNMCAVGLASDTVIPKKTKSIDMQFHWIRDRVRQQQFNVTWRQGAHNLADFFTKALPVHLHRDLMPFLVNIPPTPNSMYQTAHTRRSHVWSTAKNKMHLLECDLAPNSSQPEAYEDTFMAMPAE